MGRPSSSAQIKGGNPYPSIRQTRDQSEGVVQALDDRGHEIRQVRDEHGREVDELIDKLVAVRAANGGTIKPGVANTQPVMLSNVIAGILTAISSGGLVVASSDDINSLTLGITSLVSVISFLVPVVAGLIAKNKVTPVSQVTR